MTLLYTYIESPTHPQLPDVFPKLNIDARRFSSLRKLMQALKKQTPNIVLVEFFYGFSNNYAGANISNIDVLLRNMQMKYPRVKLVIISSKEEAKYVEKLVEIFPIEALVTQPITPNNLGIALSQATN